MTVETSVETDVVEALVSDGQFVNLVPGAAFVEIDLDPDFVDTVTEAYLSVLVYIPSTVQADLAVWGTIMVVTTDNLSLGIEDIGGTVYWWANSDIGDGFAEVVFDQWVQVEMHYIGGENEFDIRLDGVEYNGYEVESGPAPGINYLAVNSFPNAAVGSGGGTQADDTIGVDEMSWSADDWISEGGTIETRWAFESADPIADAAVTYPTPAWLGFVSDSGEITLDEGGGFLPDSFSGEFEEGDVGASVTVFIDDEEVTSCVQTGSVTRRLNRPWTATFRMFTDCAPGTACSTARVYINGDIWFHGFITQISTEAGEDGNLMSEYTCQDPMFLWQWRPARSGPDSDDPGDFSNPHIFRDPYVLGPLIMQQLLFQSEVDTDPNFGEGDLFIVYGDFPTGGVDLSGAPEDYPMTIAEAFELLASTGELDGVMTPIDSVPGKMARVDMYNGNYGTDRTASVAFEYATGAHNVRALRMTEDSTNVCNKLWYYLGPRALTVRDPAGDQHWNANITGDDPFLHYTTDGEPGPGGKSVNSDNTQYVALNNPLGDRIYDSRTGGCGVRMEVRIYDAQGDENPSEFRELYRRQWQNESWLRAEPRILIHVTPVRTSEAMSLPPGVSPIAIGDFDIGDLVTVTAGPVVRGGFTGAQRIYEYTVSWDEDGILEVGELLTSSDQEGSSPD